MFTMWDLQPCSFTMDRNAIRISMMSEIRTFAHAFMTQSVRPLGFPYMHLSLLPPEDGELKGLYYDGRFNSLYGFHIMENGALPVVFLPPTNGPDQDEFADMKFRHCCVLNPIIMNQLRGNSNKSHGFYRYGSRDWNAEDPANWAGRFQHVRDWSLSMQNAMLLLLAEHGFFKDYTPQLAWEGPVKGTLLLYALEPYEKLKTVLSEDAACTSLANISLLRQPKTRQGAYFMLPTSSIALIGTDLLDIQASSDVAIGWGFI